MSTLLVSPSVELRWYLHNAPPLCHHTTPCLFFFLETQVAHLGFELELEYCGKGRPGVLLCMYSMPLAKVKGKTLEKHMLFQKSHF